MYLCWILYFKIKYSQERSQLSFNLIWFAILLIFYLNCKPWSYLSRSRNFYVCHCVVLETEYCKVETKMDLFFRGAILSIGVWGECWPVTGGSSEERRRPSFYVDWFMPCLPQMSFTLSACIRPWCTTHLVLLEHDVSFGQRFFEVVPLRRQVAQHGAHLLGYGHLVLGHDWELWQHQRPV